MSTLAWENDLHEYKAHEADLCLQYHNLVDAKSDLAQKEATQKEMDAKVVRIQSAQKQVKSTHAAMLTER